MDVPDCENTNLKFAMYLVFIIYTGVFVLFLLQVIGCSGILKNNPKWLFVFYAIISGTMFLVQMFLFQAKNCFTQTPLVYCWLVAQVILFYLIVALGLAYWGFYICYQETIKEMQTKEIVEEFIKENFDNLQKERNTPLLLNQQTNDSSASDSDEEHKRKSKKGKKKGKKKKALAITNIDDDLD